MIHKMNYQRSKYINEKYGQILPKSKNEKKWKIMENYGKNGKKWKKINTYNLRNIKEFKLYK